MVEEGTKCRSPLSAHAEEREAEVVPARAMTGNRRKYKNSTNEASMLLKTQEGTSYFAQNEPKTNRFLTVIDRNLHENGEQTTRGLPARSSVTGLHRIGMSTGKIRRGGGGRGLKTRGPFSASLCLCGDHFDSPALRALEEPPAWEGRSELPRPDRIRTL